MKTSIRLSETESTALDDQSLWVTDERSLLIRMRIGDLVRIHRKQLDNRLTQEELAFRSGISFEHLNHIENYRAKVSIELLDRIALALGFERLSDFLGRDQTGTL